MMAMSKEYYMTMQEGKLNMFWELMIVESREGVKKSVENIEDGREKSIFFGLNYLLWFEFGIEGKIMRKRIYKYLSILPTFIL